MNKKNIIVIVILVVIAIIAVGVFVVLKKEKSPVSQQQANDQQSVQDNSQQDIDTSDWKTYVNEGWGYSIKYPSYLYIKSNTQGDKFPGDTSSDRKLSDGEIASWDGGQTLIISDKEKMGIQDIGLDERIHIEILTSRLNKDESLDSYIKRITNNSSMPLKEVSIGLIKGYEINIDQNKSIVSIYLNKNEWVYHMHGINLIDNNSESINVRLMRKIISSFEFIK